MSDGVLSQEEIDALLKSSALGTGGNGQSDAQASIDSDDLTMSEKDALSELLSKVMESSSNALSTLLEKQVEITAPYIDITDSNKVKNEHPETFQAVYFDYTSGLEGANVLLFKNNDAAAMIDMMMGGEGTVSEAPLDDMQLGAFNEAMNQMLGSATSALSSIIKKTTEITPPTVKSLDFPEGALNGNVGGTDKNLVKISFRISIDGVLDSEILELMPIELAKEMARGMGIETKSSPSQSYNHEPEASAQPQIESQHQVAATAQAANAYNQQPQAYAAPQQSSGIDNRTPAGVKREIPVQPVQFAPLQPHYSTAEIANIDLIMDVPLQLTVELGRSKKTIREILALGQGSVIELDKLAGEPVDLLVNGKLLAKGEVVVIDENFGIRVSDIISPIERVTNLQ